MFVASRRRMPILAYHAIASSADMELPSKWSRNHCVLLESFRQHLEFMREAGWKTLLPNALGRTNHVGNEKYFLLTFDDGHASDVVAAATMKRLGFRAIFYIPWLNVGSSGFLSSSDVKEVSADGFAIGSHGLTHSPLTEKSDSDLRAELLESKGRLEDLIGQPVEDLAAPFGRYNQRVIAIARAAGFRRIMTSNMGLARVGEHGVFPRIPISSRTSLEDFRKLISAGSAELIARRVAYAISRRFAVPRKPPLQHSLL